MKRMTRKSKSINSYVLKDPSAIGCMNAVDKLGDYEGLEELIGIPLKDLAEICNNKIPEECKNPKKAIVLTDEDVDRWNEYKNAEEQDLLFRLPCKVGDTVYAIDGKNIQTLKAQNDIALVSRRLCILAENCHYDDYICCDDVGETVFLTKEEAEQKLKEMESVRFRKE